MAKKAVTIKNIRSVAPRGTIVRSSLPSLGRKGGPKHSGISNIAGGSQANFGGARKLEFIDSGAEELGGGTSPRLDSVAPKLRVPESAKFTPSFSYSPGWEYKCMVNVPESERIMQRLKGWEVCAMIIRHGQEIWLFEHAIAD